MNNILIKKKVKHYFPLHLNMDPIPAPNTSEHNKMMNDIYKNIEKFDTDRHLTEFNQIIRENKHYKLNVVDLIEKMEHFHRFTPNSLEYMIDVINNNPCTFQNYGPYVKIDGYWKVINISPHNEDKINFKQKVLDYAKQINEQKNYIIQLENQIKMLTKSK